MNFCAVCVQLEKDFGPRCLELEISTMSLEYRSLKSV